MSVPNSGTDTGTAPSQGQDNSPSLDAAIGGWGDGERGGGTNPEVQRAPAQQQAAPVQQTQQAPAQQQTPPPAQQAPVLDQKSIVEAAVAATIAANRATQGQQQQRQAPAPAMTREQLYAHYGVPTVNKDVMTAIMNADPEQGAQVLNKILEQNMLATVKMMQDLGTAEISKVRNDFKPHIQSWQSYQAERAERDASERFYKSYPHLVNDSVQVKETLDALQARKNRGEITFADEAQAFKAVADAVDQTIARMSSRGVIQNGQQTPNQQTTPATASQGRRPASATQQGRGGGGPTAPASTLEALVEKW